MPLRDALGDHETQTRTGPFIDPVQPLEGFEQLAGVLHVESDPAVAHPQVHALADLFPIHVDLHPLARRGELPRIVQQLRQHALEVVLVALYGQARAHLDLRGAARIGVLQLGAHPVGEHAQVDLFASQRRAPGRGEFLQRVEHRAHARGRIADALEIVAPGIVEPGGVLTGQDREAVDRAQGGAQVVRQALGKRLLLAKLPVERCGRRRVLVGIR